MVLLIALWAQLYAACIYGWRFGDYYEYGWYVPPLAMLFFWRIRPLWSTRQASAPPWPLTLLGLIALFAALFSLRVLEHVDSRWTLPIWIQAAIVVSLTLLAMQQLGGRKALLRSIPIILFALSAIPLPSKIEGLMVSTLTDGVVASSATLLDLLGMQVHTLGDRLAFMGEVVHVTEGCSGIRSAQSFLMASLFFGELMQLSLIRRGLLLGIGLLTAWILNVIRASSLAVIQFKHGSDAFDTAHDQAGWLAFLAGSIVLLAVSSMLSSRKRRPLVRTHVERRPA